MSSYTPAVLELPAPDGDRLPNGFAIRLDPSVRRADGGRSLFGGSPGRMLYLKPAARDLLATDRVVVGDRAGATLARLLLDRGLAQPDPTAFGPVPGVPRVEDVTVVVPVRNRAPALGRLLRALGPDLGVVVVDDGSTDGGETSRVAAGAGATVVRHERSLGPAAARNTGLAHVDTALVAFVDSDVLPDPGWLQTLLPHFADPAVGLVAPRVTGVPDVATTLDTPGWRGRMLRWVAGYERARSSLDLGPTPALVAPRGRVAYLPTAAVLARTTALGAGFAEQLQVGEDVDLIWRLVEAGWRVRYEPAATVAHDHRVAVRDWLRRKAFYGTSAAPLALRHPGAVPPLASAPWAAAAWALLLAQRRWSVPAAAAVTGVATVRLARKLDRSDRPLLAAAALTPWALVSTGWQLGSALTRHWWPLTVLGCLVSRRVRRVALVAAVAEGVADRRRVQTELGPLAYTVAHRLDDLAYGAGLWWGAWRHRTSAPLLPALSSRASSVPAPGERGQNTV
jgi:mycofactocin system glycosyltransferase